MSQAHVQQQVLLALDQRPARTTTELAKRIGRDRTSTSRATNALARQKLTHRTTEGWELTAGGSNVARSLALYGVHPDPIITSRVLDQMTAATRMIDMSVPAAKVLNTSKIIDQMTAATRMIDMSVPAAKVLNTSKIVDQMTAATRMIDMSVPAAKVLNQVVATSRAFESVSDRDAKARRAFAQLGRGAIEAAVLESVESHQLLLAGLSIGATSRAWWTPVIAASLASSASITSDLAIISSASASRHRMVRNRIGDLGLATAGIVVAQHEALGESLIAMPESDDGDASTAAAITYPASGSAHYVSAARSLLAVRPSDNAYDVAIGAATKDLADRLLEIDPSLGHILLGAWDRVLVAGPDWQRSAAHAAREVVIQTLARLAPDAIDPESGKPTRASRLRCVVGSSKSLAGWVEAQINGLEATIKVLHAEAHERQATRLQTQHAMVSLLRSAESVLWLLIAFRGKDLD